MRNRLTGPRILVTREATGLAKSYFWDFVAEQSRGGFLLLVVRIVSNSASTIQATHNFICLHGAMCHRRM